MIKIEHVSKRFVNVEALNDVSLEVNPHEVVCLVGPSGSGKSTLLRTINGLEIVDNGKIFIDDVEVKADDEALMCQLRLKMGFVFQHFNLFPHLSVMDNITLSLTEVIGMSKEDAQKEALALLDRVGLKDKADVYPSKLSGGQKQRVAIARALALKPEYMLFDEPTSALDPEMVCEVLEVMQNLAHEGMGMIVVTHEMGFAKNLADRIVFLENGKIIEIDGPEKFFEDPDSDRVKDFLNKINYLK